MKKLASDLKHGIMKLRPENADDLWCLSQVIEPGDRVSGVTYRKVKIGDEQSSKSVKKRFFLTIRTEGLSLEEGSLRVSGTNELELDDIPKGSHHTISVEAGGAVTIQKEAWPRYQLERVSDSCKETGVVLVCVFDREEAIFALLNKRGHKSLSRISGEVAKKGVDVKARGFYKEIVNALEEYDKRYSPVFIVIASPAFWKEYLRAEIRDEGLKRKLVDATCSSVSEGAISEVLKRPELKKALADQRSAFEARLLDEVLAAISNDMAAYGLEEVRSAVDAGAVSKLVVADRLITGLRAEGRFRELEGVMKRAENRHAEVHIIASDEPVRSLMSLGGVAALLRYRLG